MELQQLEYFLAIAHMGNFTKAAATVSITQSALSRSIKRLETELGVELFSRNNKDVRLTGYGKMLLTHAERIVREEAMAKMEIDKFDKQVINLSFLHSLGSYIVPKLIGEFHKIHPECKFRLNQENSTTLINQLIKGKTDLCICSNLVISENISWVPLCSEELFVIVPQKHRLAGRKSVTLSDIAEESFITLKPFYGLRLLVNQLFNMTGILPRIEFEGDEIITVANLVNGNLGVSIVPRIPGLEYLDIKFLPISSPHCRRVIGMAWESNRILPQLVRNFQQFAIDTYIDEK